ncbi:MAG: NUDIX hydrolase [Alphaproteobacteria bacterium]
MENLSSTIAARLATFAPHATEEPSLRRASVALAFYADEHDEGQLVITKRAPRMNAHAGQWALPGGKLDEGETQEQAARREMAEEIGLDLPESALLGRLDDYEARSGFAITPFVYWAGQLPKMTPAPAEVAAIHAIPLNMLAHNKAFELADDDGLLIRFHFGNRQIHAPTAALLYQFREVCLLGNETRVAHLRSPGWAK